jgi:hypothetical protein
MSYEEEIVCGDCEFIGGYLTYPYCWKYEKELGPAYEDDEYGLEDSINGEIIGAWRCEQCKNEDGFEPAEAATEILMEQEELSNE